MSSLKLKISHDSPDCQGDWVEVRSPRLEDALDSKNPSRGVVLSLRAKREALEAGHLKLVEVDFAGADRTDDEGAASEISIDMDARWDD